MDLKDKKIVGLELYKSGMSLTEISKKLKISRKTITKYVKDFSWNKLKKDVKGLFSGAKEKISGLFKKKSKITPKIGVEYENAANLDFAKKFDASFQKGSADRNLRARMIRDARVAFTNKD